jgi:hypothetical protein
MQSPLQTSVWVQNEPLGQLLPLMTQGIDGRGRSGGFVVAMHCPPHGVGVAQIVVGVQTALVGQGASLPTVHGTTGG